MSINHVRFRSPVSLGSVDSPEWSADRPSSTALAGKIACRPSEISRDGAAGLVFECRIGKDHYDVLVPWSNIAHVIQTVPAQGAKKP